MVLTERDRDIIKTVHTYRLLSRSQIETLLFRPDRGQAHPTKTSRCRLRLKLLYHHGFLDRVPVRAQMGPGCSDFVYRLGQKRAESLNRDGKREIEWRASRKVLNGFFLEHTLRTNDFRIAVTFGSRTLGWSLLEWKDEVAIKQMEIKVPNPEKLTESVRFLPDAFFSLEMGQRKGRFFLEIDRGTMPGKRFAKKVKLYQMCRRSGISDVEFGTKNFRVLTVTGGKRRLNNLVNATKDAEGDHRFWFTTFDEIDTASIFKAPVWRAVNKDGLWSLAE